MLYAWTSNRFTARLVAPAHHCWTEKEKETTAGLETFPFLPLPCSGSPPPMFPLNFALKEMKNKNNQTSKFPFCSILSDSCCLQWRVIHCTIILLLTPETLFCSCVCQVPALTLGSGREARWSLVLHFSRMCLTFYLPLLGMPHATSSVLAHALHYPRHSSLLLLP